MDAKTWDAFIQQHQGSFLQSWAWGEFQAATGKEIARFQLLNTAAQFIVHPLLFKKTYVFSPYGPVGDTSGIPALLDVVRGVIAPEHQAIFWRYERGGQALGGKAVHEIHPHYTWVLTLQPPDQMLTAMKPKWRYNIRLAEKKGVKIHVSQDPKDIDQLYPLLQTTAARQNIRLHPKSYYRLMVEQLGQAGLLQLYLAEYQGNIIAGNIMVGFGKTMTYLHGGSDHNYHTVMAPHLLQWQAISAAQQAGFTTYDFFGIAPPDQPNHPWAGITRFKQGFGGHRVSYPGTYDLAFQPMWYTIYTIYGYRHRRRR